jgi:hypothetical protein
VSSINEIGRKLEESIYNEPKALCAANEVDVSSRAGAFIHRSGEVVQVEGDLRLKGVLAISRQVKILISIKGRRWRGYS